MEIENNKKRIPNIGDILPAFDDGKVRPSRMYVVEITEVIPFDDAKNIEVFGLDEDFTDALDEPIYREDLNLIDCWKKEKIRNYWLFDDNTDYFVRANVVGDIYPDQYFARTKNGGWFSMGIYSNMIGCELDSDMSLFNNWENNKWFSEDYNTYKDKFKIV